MVLLGGIIIFIIGGAALALATWMASRNDGSDGAAKVIWSFVQLMATLVAAFGVYGIYLGVTQPSSPQTVSVATTSQMNAPATSQPAVPLTRPTVSQTMGRPVLRQATLEIRVLTQTGAPVPNAQVTIAYNGFPAATQNTNPDGIASFGEQRPGMPYTIEASSPEGSATARVARMDMGDNQITVQLRPYLRAPAPAPAPVDPNAGQYPQGNPNQGSSPGTGVPPTPPASQNPTVNQGGDLSPPQNGTTGSGQVP